MHFTASSEPKEIAEGAEDDSDQKMDPKTFTEVFIFFNFLHINFFCLVYTTEGFFSSSVFSIFVFVFVQLEIKATSICVVWYFNVQYLAFLQCYLISYMCV